jgi:hypothetical protein
MLNCKFYVIGDDNSDNPGFLTLIPKFFLRMMNKKQLPIFENLTAGMPEVIPKPK